MSSISHSGQIKGKKIVNVMFDYTVLSLSLFFSLFLLFTFPQIKDNHYNMLPSQEIGVPIPNIPHAVSVTLPTWEATVGYEEGEDWVVSKMNSGYPRFLFIPRFKSCVKILKTNMVDQVKGVWFIQVIKLLNDVENLSSIILLILVNSM